MQIEITKVVRVNDEVDKAAGDFYIIDLVLDGWEEQVAFPVSKVGSREDLAALLRPWAVSMLKDRGFRQRVPEFEGLIEIQMVGLTEP